RTRPQRRFGTRCRVCRQDPARCQGRGDANRAAHEIRAGDQPQDREGARDHRTEGAAAARRPGDRVMDRRTFAASIALGVFAEPVGSGLVASLGHPGGNVTGMTLLSTDLAGKRLQLVREILPRAKRIAVLALGGLSATPLLLTALRDAGQTMDLELITQRVTKPEELPSAFTEFQKAGAHALIV